MGTGSFNGIDSNQEMIDGQPQGIAREFEAFPFNNPNAQKALKQLVKI